MKCLLESGSGGDGVGGTGKDREAAVAFSARPHDLSLVLGDDLLDKRIVAHEGSACRSRVLFPEPGAALDVGEEEGDRAGGKIRHADSCYVCSPCSIACVSIVPAGRVCEQDVSFGIC